jgi:hypothetical protein
VTELHHRNAGLSLTQGSRSLHEDSERYQRLGTDVLAQLVVVQQDIERGLGNVGVDLGERVAELCDVDRDQLVRVLDAVVQVA